MPDLHDALCTAVLEELGYFRDFHDPSGPIRISSGRVAGPKAIAFAALAADETIPSELFMMWLKRWAGIDPGACDATLDKVLETMI